MDSMTDQTRVVIGGVDAHVDSHHAAALDLQGRLLGSAQFPTTSAGYRSLHDWLAEFGELRCVVSSRPAPTALASLACSRHGG